MNLRGVTYILARSRYAYETQSTGNDDAADNLLTLQRRVGNIKRDIGAENGIFRPLIGSGQT